MGFDGWPAEALEFYEGLLADNSRTYWLAHKDTYEQAVRAPMVALLAELEPEFGPARIYRPYRDLRFSADKSPYKTQIAAVFERGGYLRLSADGLGAGSGMYRLDPERLQRWRDAVADERSGAALAQVVDRLRRDGLDVSSREVLSRVPSGYPKDSPRAELLRYKDVVAWRDWPVEPWLGTPRAREEVEGFFRACRPLVDWLQAHVA